MSRFCQSIDNLNIDFDFQYFALKDVLSMLSMLFMLLSSCLKSAAMIFFFVLNYRISQILAPFHYIRIFLYIQFVYRISFMT